MFRQRDAVYQAEDIHAVCVGVMLPSEARTKRDKI